jgi:hypothetical protein
LAWQVAENKTDILYLALYNSRRFSFCSFQQSTVQPERPTSPSIEAVAEGGQELQQGTEKGPEASSQATEKADEGVAEAASRH